MTGKIRVSTHGHIMGGGGSNNGKKGEIEVEETSNQVQQRREQGRKEGGRRGGERGGIYRLYGDTRRCTIERGEDLDES